MKIGNRVNNPGELRTQVILAKRVISEDAGGFPTVSFGLIAQVWSRWVNVHGSEAWTSSSLGFTSPATVLIRHRAELDTTCVVIKSGQLNGTVITGGEIFQIVSMDNIQERNEYLELKVQKTKAG
ncbi:MAG: head-tail adaptor protein [Anaerolineaceae bacterium]